MHGICDFLEYIDHSICMLDEARQDSYYWIIDKIDLYWPNVFERSILNLAYNVISKHRLMKMVGVRKVWGWTNPRMPTTKGLGRRGYTANIIN